jgi:ABC-type branched-subunit amino acid transport system permease subunit
MAFAMGAAIAGLSGALFAAWQGSVFPNNFDVTLLITIYAIIVLGGLGSLPGVVIGALIMIAAPEALRNIGLAGVLFYIGILVILATTLKPRWHFPAALGALVVLGLVLKLIFPSIGTLPASGSPITEAIRRWLVLPEDPTQAGNLAFLALVIMVLVVSRLKDARWRLVALVPTLYLMAFVWETRLSQEPSVTRLIFVGVLLVVLMVYRPQGLLGKRRVEVV